MLGMCGLHTQLGHYATVDPLPSGLYWEGCLPSQGAPVEFDADETEESRWGLAAVVRRGIHRLLGPALCLLSRQQPHQLRRAGILIGWEQLTKVSRSATIS